MFSVVFDMDGTLLDTQRICIPAWEYAGEKQGIKNMGECIYDVCGMNEIGWSKYITDRFPSIDLTAFKENMRRYIIENSKVVFKSGAGELLGFLKANNIKIALASGSSRASIDHHLKEVQATDYFDAIVGGHDVQNGKPAPDIFLLAAEKLGVAPESCFVFEDSANGIRAGHSAGMKCIGVPDIVPFSDDIKKLMLAELGSLSEAIELLKPYI